LKPLKQKSICSDEPKNELQSIFMQFTTKRASFTQKKIFLCVQTSHPTALKARIFCSVLFGIQRDDTLF
jgi:hypothetical protein